MVWEGPLWVFTEDGCETKVLGIWGKSLVLCWSLSSVTYKN